MVNSSNKGHENRLIEHFSEDYSIIMGIVDLIPVILFALAGCTIIKELFGELRKPFAVLLCSGVTLSLTAGVYLLNRKGFMAFQPKPE